MNNLSKEKQAICDAVLNQFLMLYPACFSLENKKPLKIKITKELVKLHPEIEKNYISIVINNYVKTADYYAVFVNYSHRVDLNGDKAGEITEKEKYHAENFEENQIIRAEKSAIKRAKKAAEQQAELEELEQLRLQGYDIEKIIEERKAATEQLKAERKAANKELCRLKKIRKKAHQREEKLRAEKKAAEEQANQKQTEKQKPVQEPEKPQVKKLKLELPKKQSSEKEPVKIIIKPKRRIIIKPE